MQAAINSIFVNLYSGGESKWILYYPNFLSKFALPEINEINVIGLQEV
jgi:hypothetical protein